MRLIQRLQLFLRAAEEPIKPMDGKDMSFLKHRRRLVAHWHIAAFSLVVVWVVFGLSFWVRARNLVDPFYVIKQVETQTLSSSTVELMAVLLPVAFWCILLLLISIIVLVCAAMSNEKKYLGIIDALLAEKAKHSGEG